MSKTAAVAVFVALVLIAAIPAEAQLNRSFVSTTGSDANPCTAGAPCRSFGAAMAVTNVGGEILAIDSGGYGAFTTDRSVTVVAAPGVHAAITAASGDAIRIDSGLDGEVILRNLNLNGLGTGATGVYVGVSGRTTQIDNVTIANFVGPGVWATLGTVLTDLTVTGVDTGILIGNPELPVYSMIDRALVTHLLDNDNADRMGIVCLHGRCTVRNSVVVDASYAFAVDNSGSLTLENNVATGSVVGVYCGVGYLWLSNNVISGNLVGIDVMSAGDFCEAYTFQNNKLSQNGTDINGGLTLKAPH